MIKVAIFSIFLFELILLFGGYKVLIKEEHIEVNKGISRIVKGYGDLGIGNQDALVCTYFNGRKIIEYVFWYSPSNFLGKSECLFFFK
jgi:hypothetical protein